MVPFFVLKTKVSWFEEEPLNMALLILNSDSEPAVLVDTISGTI
jgi:hypothetical protein